MKTIDSIKNYLEQRKWETEEINRGVINSFIIDGFDDIEDTDNINEFTTSIEVMDMTIDEVLDMFNGEHVGVLNNSSFLEADAEYEILYKILKKNNKFYKENKKNLNEYLYSNRAIITPGYKLTEDSICNFVTIAAPDFMKFKKEKSNGYLPYSSLIQRNNSALKERIDFLLGVMKYTKQEDIVIDAFGCFRHAQSPMVVASIFHNLLETKYVNTFKKVIFAIPAGDDGNYKAFKYAFSKEGIYKKEDDDLKQFNVVWFNPLSLKEEIVHIVASNLEEATKAAIMIFNKTCGVEHYNENDIDCIECVDDIDQYLTLEDIKKQLK